MRTPFALIETERLLVRRFRPDDLATFLAYRNDPEVARYQSWESIAEADGVVFIREQQVEEPGQRGAWFQFAVEHRASRRLIGDCGLGIKADDERQAEIGFTFARRDQGHGYATEAVRAVLGYAFGALALHRVVGICDTRNDRSARLMERVGMRREAHFRQNAWFKGAWSDEYLYAILRDEWTARPR